MYLNRLPRIPSKSSSVRVERYLKFCSSNNNPYNIELISFFWCFKEAFERSPSFAICHLLSLQVLNLFKVIWILPSDLFCFFRERWEEAERIIRTCGIRMGRDLSPSQSGVLMNSSSESNETLKTASLSSESTREVSIDFQNLLLLSNDTLTLDGRRISCLRFV